MNSTCYKRIDRVYFHKDNVGAGFNYVREFEDSYDTITITTYAEIDFVHRGWLGDITYWATNGVDIKNYEVTDLTSECIQVKDALCVRVEVISKPDDPVEWTYTFLKY